MPTVYIVQNSLKRDATGAMVPKHDTRTAAQFGPTVDLLGPGAAPWSLGVVDELYRKLAGFTSEDFLVLIGSPVLIGYAFTIAAEMADGKFTVLQWDGKRDCYFPVKCDLKWPEDQE